MDRFKGIAKGGWHPPGDPTFHRDSWKSDLKGMATGKKKDPYEEQRNHQSTPLASLKDPDSFGAPPRHTAYHGSDAATPSRITPAPAGGLGAPVPAPRPRQEQAQTQTEEPPRPPEPYRADTSGLRTDNLPKPPVRRMNGGGTASPMGTASPGLPARTASPSLPPRQMPAVPPRQAAKPPPGLPPRMSENPTEFSPAPPPTYGEAMKSGPEAGLLNQGAVNRLAQAGVSVPGFGMGAPSAPSSSSSASNRPSAPQLSELQQRFSRMNTGSSSQTPLGSQTPSLPSLAAAVTGKKAPPPPPPPKKSGLNNGGRPNGSSGAMEPPPLPLASKPRPGG